MATLSINASGSIELRNGTELKWESNVPDAYSENKFGGSLTINQAKRGGSTMVINTGRGNVAQTVVSGGGGSVFIGDLVGGCVIGGSSGGVWVNGKRVDVPDDGSPIPETPYLIVYVPPGTNVDVKTNSSSNVAGNAQIGVLSIKTSGSTDVDLTCYAARLNTSGSSDITLRLGEGGLKSDFSGSTELEIIK